MDRQSALSLANPRLVVDIRTARTANLALKKKIAAEKYAKNAEEKANTGSTPTGLGFSVLRIGSALGGHTAPDASNRQPSPGGAGAAGQTSAVEFL